MKSIFLLTFCLIVGFPATSTPARDFEKYFELEAEKYKEAEGEYVGVSPGTQFLKPFVSRQFLRPLIKTDPPELNSSRTSWLISRKSQTKKN